MGFSIDGNENSANFKKSDTLAPMEKFKIKISEISIGNALLSVNTPQTLKDSVSSSSIFNNVKKAIANNINNEDGKKRFNPEEIGKTQFGGGDLNNGCGGLNNYAVVAQKGNKYVVALENQKGELPDGKDGSFIKAEVTESTNYMGESTKTITILGLSNGTQNAKGVTNFEPVPVEGITQGQEKYLNQAAITIKEKILNKNYDPSNATIKKEFDDITVNYFVPGQIQKIKFVGSKGQFNGNVLARESFAKPIKNSGSLD